MHLRCPSCDVHLVTWVAAQPPPVSLSTRAAWYAVIGGQRVGPLSTTGLRARIHAGEVRRDDLVWTEGLDSWRAANSQAALAGAFSRGTGPILRLVTPPPRPADGHGAFNTLPEQRAVNHSGDHGLVQQPDLAQDEDASDEWEGGETGDSDLEALSLHLDNEWGAKHLPPLDDELYDIEFRRLPTTEEEPAVSRPGVAGLEVRVERGTMPDRPSVKGLAERRESATPLERPTVRRPAPPAPPAGLQAPPPPPPPPPGPPDGPIPGPWGNDRPQQS